MLLLLPSVTQQAQDVQCPSNGFLIFSMLPGCVDKLRDRSRISASAPMNRVHIDVRAGMVRQFELFTLLALCALSSWMIGANMQYKFIVAQ
jgi:hypothetical protein